MDHLDQAINHINVSISNPIDRQTLIDCIKGENNDPEWKYHVLTFFLETHIGVVHDIVLDGIFTFEELYMTYQRWDDVGYAWGETADWIMEMYYLEAGRGNELDKWRFYKERW